MAEAEDWKAKFESLVAELNDVTDTIGIYPAAIVGQYEKRDDYKNGWNDAAMELSKKIDGIVVKYREMVMPGDLKLLADAEVGFFRDGQFWLNMNDVWAWAMSYCEQVPEDQIHEVARLFRAYGWMGCLYWVSKKNDNMKSEFVDNNRFIEIVEHEEKLIQEVPGSSARAYKKIKYTVGE